MSLTGCNVETPCVIKFGGAQTCVNTHHRITYLKASNQVTNLFGDSLTTGICDSTKYNVLAIKCSITCLYSFNCMLP